MSYIILDLEWNASYSTRLHGFVNEIIEFGAVKLDESYQIVDTFSVMVKPKIGKRLNGTVKKLTGISLACGAEKQRSRFSHGGAAFFGISRRRHPHDVGHLRHSRAA